MTDTNQLMQVVNQISTLGVDLTKAITPYAMAGAKLQALQYLASSTLGIIAGLIAIILSIFCLIRAKKTGNDKRILLFLFFLAFSSVCICVSFSQFVLNYYGYNHPDAYLAYQAVGKIMGN